jgi:ADP-heptose:LPS heptosyltransferase
LTPGNLETEHENNLIVIHGGIGDVLLWIPTLKEFRQKPDVLFLYETPALSILKENNLVNAVFSAKGKIALLKFAAEHKGYYDNVFLNHLCGGSLLLKTMQICSDSVITNSENFGESKGKLVVKDIKRNIQDAEQNYFLVHGRANKLELEDLRLLFTSSIKIPSSNYICINLVAGNNNTPYKNWPLKNWKIFIESVLQEFPSLNIILIGGKEEAELVDKAGFSDPRIISYIGKTTINEAGTLLANSKFFIGPDGGLLHLAVTTGVKTMSIWGGSSKVHYGYDGLFPQIHFSVSKDLSCSPCSVWVDPNTTRTSDPLKCPDFACLTTLAPAFVLQEFKKYFPN